MRDMRCETGDARRETRGTRRETRHLTGPTGVLISHARAQPGYRRELVQLRCFHYARRGVHGPCEPRAIAFAPCRTVLVERSHGAAEIECGRRAGRVCQAAAAVHLGANAETSVRL